MWYLVYEDYEDFFIGEKPPIEVPKNFSSLDELLEFAKKHNMEAKCTENVCELYIKSPEYTARFEFHK